MSKAVLALLGLLVAPGCVIALEDDDPYHYDYDDYGALVVDWTVAQAHDWRECARLDADSIVIAIESGSGRPIDAFYQACDAFGTRIDLPEGRYRASAALLGRSGERLTTYVELGSFSIYEDEASLVAIDFPDDSFL